MKWDQEQLKKDAQELEKLHRAGSDTAKELSTWLEEVSEKSKSLFQVLIMQQMISKTLPIYHIFKRKG